MEGSVCERVGAAGPPATLIRNATAPVVADSFSTSSASVRSATTTPAAGWMSVAITSTPSCFSRLTIEEPIPLAAPVTSALRPFRPSSGIRGAVGVHAYAGHIGSVVTAERHDQRGALADRPHPSHRNAGEGTFRAMVRF